MTFFLSSLFIVLVFWRPQEWLIPWLFGWPLLDIIVFSAVLLFILEADQGRVRFPKNAPQPYLLIGLWLATVMSHIAHTYFAGMMKTIPEVFKICFFTLLLFSVLDRPSRLRMIAQMFVAMACIMSIHAIMQSRRGYGFALQSPLFIPATITHQAYIRSRFFGIFEDPNDLAQILATSIPFTFVIFKRKSFIRFLISLAIACLLITAVLTTHSRGGMISMAVTGFIMLVLILPSRFLPVSMIIIAIGALMLCPLSAGYLDNSAHDRVVFWGQANWVFKNNMLFGVGYGMFPEYIDKSRVAHNAFVSCYTELGLFGFWFWFCLLLLAIIGAWRTRTIFMSPENEEEAWIKKFAGISIAAMSTFCTSAYFLSRTFIYPMFFLFALLGAIPVIAKNYLPENHPPIISFFKDVIIIGTIGTITCILYIYFSIQLLNKAFYT